MTTRQFKAWNDSARMATCFEPIYKPEVGEKGFEENDHAEVGKSPTNKNWLKVDDEK